MSKISKGIYGLREIMAENGVETTAEEVNKIFIKRSKQRKPNPVCIKCKRFAETNGMCFDGLTVERTNHGTSMYFDTTNCFQG